MQNFKNNNHSIKRNNTAYILNALSELKTATRGQLAQLTGLSQPTVNSIIQNLEESGVVCAGSFAASAGGRRPQCYVLKTDHLRALTIRVYTHGFEYAVMTVDGTVVQRNLWTATINDAPLHGLQALIRTIIGQDSNIRVICIGVPGVVGPGGVLYAIFQIPELDGIPLARVLQDQFQIPVYVENDMNLVALGSVTDRYEQQISSLIDAIVVTIGNGIGAGIIIGGHIIRGFSSFAGEIGYIKNPSCECRDSETIENLVNKAEGLEHKSRYIAEFLIDIICLINPPAIAFCGNLASEEMLRHVRHECEKHLPLWALPSFQIMADENAAYDRGLLAMVRDDILKDAAVESL
jgi:predicted NBD/HSP70 family sugar kinase